jgi:dihydroxyacetone kinase-like protein
MMKDLALDSTALRGLLLAVAPALAGHSEEIRELDARVGDGDLGVTVELMAKALVEFAESSSETDVGRLLAQCGMAVNRANPSTFGTIIATGLMGGGKAVMGKTSVGMAEGVAMGEGAIEAIKSRGKASVGDKTLLDALVPAVVALSAEQVKGSDARTAVWAAVRAAEEGMRATTGMVAKCGKARAFQEKSVGVQDGGATAVYFMLKAAAEYIGAEGERG